MIERFWETSRFLRRNQWFSIVSRGHAAAENRTGDIAQKNRQKNRKDPPHDTGHDTKKCTRWVAGF